MKNVYRSSCKVPASYSRQILTKLEFYEQDFRKSSLKSVQWEKSCSMWTDRYYEANRRFSQIATASKNYFHQPAIFVTWAVCWLTYVKRGTERGSLDNVKFTQ